MRLNQIFSGLIVQLMMYLVLISKKSLQNHPDEMINSNFVAIRDI